MLISVHLNTMDMFLNSVFMALVMLMWFLPDQRAKEWREKINNKE